MEKDIEELKGLFKNKVDCSLFDEEIEKIKDLINSISSSGKGGEVKPIVQSGPSISSKELNELREAMKKIWEHDDLLKQLNIEKLLKRIHDLEKDVKEKADKKHVKEDFEKVWKELSELKDLLSKLES